MSEISGGDINYLPDTNTVIVPGSVYHSKQEKPSLTREEVEQRLEEKVEGTKRLVATGREREALQTALAVMDERDEILTAKKRDSQMAIRYYSKYQEAIVERDALVAEGRLLREALEHCHTDYGTCCQDCPLCYESAGKEHCFIEQGENIAPLITAEAARVRRLEDVLEAAEEYRDSERIQLVNDYKYDKPKYERQQRAKKALDAAIAAYREGERPGGEVCHEKITAREKKGGD